MASLLSSVSTFSDGSLQVVHQPIFEPWPNLFRVLHDLETPKGNWRPGMPAVHPLFDNHFTPFTAAWQMTSYALNMLTADKWTAVYGNERAFSNSNGFGDDTDPRANYVTMRDLTRPLPKVEALVCGGAVLAGTVSGDDLIVETLNGRVAPPPLAWLLERPWLWFDAVTVDGNGIPRRFPQGGGQRVIIPLIADRTRYPVVTIPLEKVVRWQGSVLPDAYRIYL